MYFRDRFDAGAQLAAALRPYAQRPDVLVLALPRGGVPIGYEVARALGVPWDVFLVRKLGVPGHEELAMGAVASGGVRVLNEDVVERLQIPPTAIEEAAHRERREIERRQQAYRGNRPPPDVAGKTVILVDDGLATGSTMRAAIRSLRAQQPARIVGAAPVAALPTCRDLRHEADEFVCLMTPEPFYAVGLYYDNFSQVTDTEVRSLLGQSEPTPPDDDLL